MKIKEGNYKLYKISSNSAKSAENVKEGLLMDNCTAFIKEDNTLSCSLNYHSDLVPFEWFRSSPIEKIVYKDPSKIYIIETRNSVYKLERID